MIDRRSFLSGAGAGILGANFPVWGSPPAARPNILIITTDQQSVDAASYRMGTKYIRTPNMDSIAANGMVFDRAYCANPLCVPSRTSLFTGRYPTETGVMSNDDRTKVSLDPQKFPLMGKIFQSGGYHTGYFGKWHLPCPEKETGVHGFATIGASQDDPRTAADAVKFLQAKHDAPFLMMASFLNPHNICEWARGQALPLGEVGQPPSLDACPPVRPNLEVQKNEPDIVALIRRSYQSAPMFPVGNFDVKKWREYLWTYYRLIEKVDAEIGKVLRALRESGLEENTLIVLSADHGDCQGAHRWNQKTILFEEAARVPFVLSQKGVTRPGTSSRLVNTGLDLIPTLCDYAGIPIPGSLPGLSLKETANGNNAADPRQYVVVSNRMVQGAEVDGRIPMPEGRMVRGQRYKYCAYSEGKHRESLVDLEKDPGEAVNLAGNPQYQRTLDQHRALLAEWCRRTHDSFAVPAVSAG
jgi:choline-sulfatase